MMTAHEAHKKFTTTLKELVVIACTEYDSCFVFQAVPPKYATKELVGKVFDSLYSVSKNSGKVTRFKPFDIPAAEFERGKRLLEYNKF